MRSFFSKRFRASEAHPGSTQSFGVYFLIGSLIWVEFERRSPEVYNKDIRSRLTGITTNMYCVDCGEEISKDANYCVGCGKALKSSEGVVRKKKIRFSWVWLGLIILILGFMFIGYSSSIKEKQFDAGSVILGYGTVIFVVGFFIWFIRWLVKKVKKDKSKN